jgi:hypothetical protein
LTEPVRDHHGHRHVAVAHEFLSPGAVERRPIRRFIRCCPHAQTSFGAQPLHQPRAHFRTILIDDGDADARGRGVLLPSEHEREDREEHDRQHEGERLRDPVAPQIEEPDAQQRPHYSRNSLPVR